MKKKNLIALILTVSTIASVGGMGVSAATTSTLNKATVGSTATTNKKGKVVNVKTYLNVRQSADVKSKSLAKLKNNESVTLISKSGDWYKVKTSKGVTGYVSKAYIKEVSTGSTTTNGGTSIANKKGKVVNVKTYLNVRQSASVKSKSLAKLKNNESVTLISKSGDWYKVKTSKGITGYVSKSYIKEVSTSSSTNTNLGTGTINMKGGVQLRKTASWKAPKLKVIKNGEKVTVLSESKGWYKVKSGNQTGYVACDYVNLSTNSKGLTKVSNLPKGVASHGTIGNYKLYSTNCPDAKDYGDGLIDSDFYFKNTKTGVIYKLHYAGKESAHTTLPMYKGYLTPQVCMDSDTGRLYLVDNAGKLNYVDLNGTTPKVSNISKAKDVLYITSKIRNSKNSIYFVDYSKNVYSYSPKDGSVSKVKLLDENNKEVKMSTYTEKYSEVLLVGDENAVLLNETCADNPNPLFIAYRDEKSEPYKLKYVTTAEINKIVDDMYDQK